MDNNYEVNNNAENNNSINNEEIPSSERKKMPIWLKIIIIVLIVVLFLIVAIFGLYKSTVDVSDKFSDKFDYILSDKHEIKEYSYLDFVSYDSNNDNYLSIEVPKDYIYDKLVNIQNINADLKDKYEISLNRIGVLSNLIEKNCVDFYVDVTYKNKINALVTGTIEYKFTNDNGIQLFLKKLVIGDGLPMFLYKNFIPFKDGDMIYELKSDNYDCLREKILLLSCIEKINIGTKSVKFNYNYMSNLKAISEYIFDDEAKNINDSLEILMPIVLDIIINNNADEYIEMAELILPLITDGLLNN